jgi:hypothetical protein
MKQNSKGNVNYSPTQNLDISVGRRDFNLQYDVTFDSNTLVGWNVTFLTLCKKIYYVGKLEIDLELLQKQ